MASDAPIAHPVRVLFLDVDGTLTDGVIGFTRDGDVRNFWVRDGLALEWARDLGVRPVVITGRASLAVEARMHDLRLEYYLGAKDKVAVAEQVLAREGVRWNECVMVGDDLPDVPMLKRVGWPIAVADALPRSSRSRRPSRTRAPGTARCARRSSACCSTMAAGTKCSNATRRCERSSRRRACVRRDRARAWR